MYKYTAKLVRVIDGDTVILDVDLGYTVHVTVTFRLDGINAPEMTGENKLDGQASKAALQKILDNAVPDAKGNKLIYVDSTGRDKYGRWVAKLVVYNTTDAEPFDVSERLIAEGFAVKAIY